MNIVLVDDHAHVRKSMRALLEDGIPGVIVREAGDGDEALAIVDTDVDVVVLDLSMPGRSGMEVLVQLRQRLPSLPILIVSLYNEDMVAMRALKLGAAGYLTKTAPPEQLVAAIVKVARTSRAS